MTVTGWVIAWVIMLMPLLLWLPVLVWMLLDIRSMNRQINAYREWGKIKHRQTMNEWREKHGRN